MKHRNKVALLLLLLAGLLGLLVLQIAVHTLEKAAFPQKYSGAVQQYAAQYQVDPHLVYAIIRTESGFKADAVSQAGARGLMQMTEETFTWLKEKIAPQEDIHFEDLDTPEVSIRFGTYFLSVCLARYAGDVSTAAAAYHSGLGKVDELVQNEQYSADGKTLHTFPYSQMNNYVNKVNRNLEKYKALYAVQE